MADHRVLWTDTAVADLREIIDVIAADDSTVALGILDRIQKRCQRIATLPERGRIVPDLRVVDVLTYREVIEPPWRIIYRTEQNRVYVTAVLDARRSLAGLLLERLARA